MTDKQALDGREKAKSKGAVRQKSGKKRKARWEKPVLEDVSGKVMAQPYIRFT